jgi:hypothetical protein
MMCPAMGLPMIPSPMNPTLLMLECFCRCSNLETPGDRTVIRRTAWSDATVGRFRASPVGRGASRHPALQFVATGRSRCASPDTRRDAPWALRDPGIPKKQGGARGRRALGDAYTTERCHEIGSCAGSLLSGDLRVRAPARPPPAPEYRSINRCARAKPAWTCSGSNMRIALQTNPSATST